MIWRLYLILSSLNLLWHVSAVICRPRAVSIPLKSYALETTAQARGISMRIGSPAQQMVLVANPWLNATYVYGTPRANGWCPDLWSDEVCITYRGGQYDVASSSSAAIGRTVLRRADDDTPANWTRDDIQLQNTTLDVINLTQYEFGIRTESVNVFVPKAELGMGRDSTFIKALTDLGRSASNSWSLYWGSEVTNPPRDGSITIGGYDSAIVGNSSNITIPLDLYNGDCKEGMVVDLTGMTLQTVAKTDDVMQGLGRQKLCVIPSVSNLLTLPTRYWDRMQNIMGVELHPFANGTAETYHYNTTIVTANSASYSGNLSIQINEALTVTIPNEMLIFDETYIGSDTGIIQTKDDIKTIPIVRRDDIMPRLGAMFFSQAYLMVNFDRGEFVISQATHNAGEQKLVGMDTANNCLAEANKDTDTAVTLPPSSVSSGVSGSGSGSGSDSGTTTTSGSSLSGGALAGVVVGAVGGLAVLGAIAFFLWRRRRAALDRGRAELDEGAFSPQPVAEKYGHESSEMYAGVATSELMQKQDHQHTAELDGGYAPIEAPASEMIPLRDSTVRL